jgi:sugar phosphate isomerase/epimerase
LIPAILGFAEEHARFIKDVGSEQIVGCLDTGHSLICGEKPHEAIHHLGQSLKALHVHDSNGYEDSHALPYAMNGDWNCILKALADIDYDGDLTFEVLSFFKNCPDNLFPKALRYLCEVGRYMIEEIANYKNAYRN